ncbi:MAG: YjgP/YjgQ family permease [Calditrichaeota bacterium]|nr:MAG: YjgP/YjgQ family permease [Calditrichota bacterium]
MFLFKKLDRYLLRLFFVTLAVVTLSIGFMIIVINLVELLRHFIDNEVPTEQIIEYYLYFGGWVIKSFFPVFILLTTLFTLSFLARKNEILAMKASGLSLYRITAPIIFVVLLLSAGHFYYNEYIFPPANQRLNEIKEFEIKNRSRHSYENVTNISRQISSGNFYTMSMFKVKSQEGVNFKLYNTANNKLKKLVTSERITFTNHQWIARNGVMRLFDDSTQSEFFKFDSLKIPEIKEAPEDLAKRVGKPEDMGLEELKEHIALMKRTGGPHIRESIDLQIKYAYPLASFIVMLISIPFAANPRKGGIAVSFSVGALIALVYFVLFKVLQTAGYNERVPDYVAVWGVNALFFLLGVIALIKARK